jgi:hypothetical protein
VVGVNDAFVLVVGVVKAVVGNGLRLVVIVIVPDAELNTVRDEVIVGDFVFIQVVTIGVILIVTEIVVVNVLGFEVAIGLCVL